MKTKLLLLAMAIYVGVANAQITLENEYINNYPPTLQSFYPVNLGNSGIKYVLLNSDHFTIFNLNHSIYKIANIPIAYQVERDILFISETLFDLDSTTIEYMVAGRGSTYQVTILKEDSVVFFQRDSAYARYPGIFSGVPVMPIWQSICETDSGTKMILGNKWNGDIYVYNLPGTLPKDCQNFTTDVGMQFNSSSSDLSHPYPNPSQNSTQVNYKLPEGEKTGEIIFYNLNGTEVKRFKVDNTFNHLVLNNSDLPSGTYLYHLVTPTQATNAKKMMVIK